MLFSSRADLLKSRLDLRLVLFAGSFPLDQVLLPRVILLVRVFADPVVFVDPLDFDTLVFLAPLAPVFPAPLAPVFPAPLAPVFLALLSLIFLALSFFASLVVFLALISPYPTSLVLAFLALAF